MTSSRLLPPTALLVVAMLLAGCELLAPGASLDGRTFLSTAVVEDGQPRPLVPGTQIRLGFHDGRIAASAGCNTLRGTYRLDGNRLLVDDLATTEMGCDPARHEQDVWLAGVLTSRPVVRPSGHELAIESDRTVITLLDREVAEPDLPLVGTLWRLSEIRSGDVVSSVPGGVVATIRFGGDGQVSVDTGCNSGGGRAEASQGRLRFVDLVLTDRACGDPAGQVEAAVIAVLGADEIIYEIDADRLVLEAGGAGLGFSGR